MTTGSFIKYKNHGKWRVITLLSIHLLFIIHIIHWQLNQYTLAPLELNELLYTLESGIVTAGFLLMLVAAALTLVLGRFFCGWFCHFLALQDFSAWLLKKIGIRPHAIRSRFLWMIPMWVMFYMFIWPQFKRFWDGRALPPIRIEGANSDWASFITDDFWRNLPDPWIAGLTFLICGFALIYVLGSRGFCTNICPYGAIFSAADKLAPGKIVLTGSCDGCGICTAQCDSQIRIHQEISTFGKVVDSNCLKDLDCVDVCPRSALGFGFTTPTALTKHARPLRKQLKTHFKATEEAMMASVFILTTLIYRGLYDAVPLLMSLGIAAIYAYFSVITYRLMVRNNLRIKSYWLRQNGKLTSAGKNFFSLVGVMIIFSIHSAAIRWHENQGSQHLIKANFFSDHREYTLSQIHAKKSLNSLEFVNQWGLFNSTSLQRKMATGFDLIGDQQRAKHLFEKVIQSNPDDLIVKWKLAMYQMREKKINQARLALIELTEVSKHKVHLSSHERNVFSQSHMILGQFHEKDREFQRAIAEYQMALKANPEYQPALMALQLINASDHQ